MLGREHTDREYEHELRQLREKLLAEMVVFMVEGEDVRHQTSRDEPAIPEDFN